MPSLSDSEALPAGRVPAILSGRAFEVGVNYFGEIREESPAVASQAGQLVRLYTEIAEALAEASDKELPPAEKIARLKTAKTVEGQAIEAVEDLMTALRSISANELPV